MNVRILVVSGLLLAPLAAPGQQPAAAPAAAPAAPAAGPRLVVEPASWDFGKVVSSTGERLRDVSKEFTLRNSGSEDLVIESVTTTCGCTLVGEYDKVVKPGRSTALQVKINLPKLEGPIEKAVLVRSNDPEHKTLSIRLSATLSAAAEK